MVFDEHLSDNFVSTIRLGQPVIIEKSNIVCSDKWNGPDRLREQLKNSSLTTKQSPTSKFRYYDEKMNTAGYKTEPPVIESTLKWDEVVHRIDEINEGNLPNRLYVQESLSGHPEMANEFGSWSWVWLLELNKKMDWGLDMINELFIGMRDCETPLHMDERENFFFQVSGEKEVVLFDYAEYPNLYLFPVSHPCDRQSMVDINNPTDEQPKFLNCVGWRSVLRAGDLLYIPYGWFHWLKNLADYTTSISFWSMTVPNPAVTEDLVIDEHLKNRVRRNIEKTLSDLVTAPKMTDTMRIMKAFILAKMPEKHPHWNTIAYLLSAVKIPREEWADFMFSMIEGRYDVEPSKYV